MKYTLTSFYAENLFLRNGLLTFDLWSNCPILNSCQESKTLSKAQKVAICWGYVGYFLAGFSFFWLIYALEDLRIEPRAFIPYRHTLFQKEDLGNLEWFEMKAFVLFSFIFPFHELKCFWESLRWLIPSEEKLRNASNRWWLKTRAMALQLFFIFLSFLVFENKLLFIMFFMFRNWKQNI